MKEFIELAKLIEIILKVKQKGNLDILRDLYEKEEKIIEKIAYNYEESYLNILETIENKWGYNFDMPIISNMRKKTPLLPDSYFAAFIKIYELKVFFNYQEFSTLTPKEMITLLYNPYYARIMEEFEEWQKKEEMFLEITQEEENVNYQVLADDLAIMYATLIRQDMPLTDDDIDIFKHYLEKINSKTSIEQALQTHFQIPTNMENFQKLKSIFEPYGIELKPKKEDYTDSVTYYSFNTIREYESYLYSLKALDTRIIHIFEELVEKKLANEEIPAVLISAIKSLLAQEEKIYKNISDIDSFAEYVYKTNDFFVSWLPYEIGDYIPVKGSSDFIENNKKEETLILQRIANYILVSNDKGEEFHQDGILVDVLEGIFDNSIIMAQDALICYAFGEISLEELFEKIRNGNSTANEDENEKNLWIRINNEFLDYLLKNGHLDMFYYYTFMYNREFLHLIDSNLEDKIDLEKYGDFYVGEEDYKHLKPAIINELNSIKENVKNNEQKSLANAYIKICNGYLASNDKQDYMTLSLSRTKKNL